MMQTCMLWAWKDESMNEYSPFSSLALISKDTEIIAVLLQICCISDAHKKSRKKEELPRADSWHLSTAVFTACWGLLCFTPMTGTQHCTNTALPQGVPTKLWTVCSAEGLSLSHHEETVFARCRWKDLDRCNVNPPIVSRHCFP